MFREGIEEEGEEDDEEEGTGSQLVMDINPPNHCVVRQCSSTDGICSSSTGIEEEEEVVAAAKAVRAICEQCATL